MQNDDIMLQKRGLMMSQFLSIKARVSLETLRELLTSEEATPRTRTGGKTFDMAGASDARYLPLPDIAMERSNRM